MRNYQRFAMGTIGVLAAGALASCGLRIGSIEGSGVAESTVYELDTFDQVKVGGAFNADITIEPGSPSVEVIVDDNLTQYVELEVTDGRLEAGFSRGNFRFDVGPELIITMPMIDGLEASGATNTTLVGLDSETFDLEVSGASEVDIDGSTETLKIDLSGASTLLMDGTAATVTVDASGASNLELEKLSAQSMNLDMSGASSGELGDVATVSGELSGASTIEVGAGSNVSLETSGASSIDRR